MHPPERLAVAFATTLRGAGVDVATSRVMAFTEALDVVSLDRRDDVYWSGRATLLSQHDDVDIYDAAFAVFWSGVRESVEVVEPPPPPAVTLMTDDDPDEAEGDDPEAVDEADASCSTKSRTFRRRS